MKKIVMCLMAALLSLTFIPLQLSGADKKEPTSVVVPNPADSAKVVALENRLNEIKVMDKETMKAEEKKEMRNEVRSIKKELRELGGGVYLSAAAIILIVILLIVLL